LITDDELERMWKEAVVSCSRYCPGIFLERLRKTQKMSIAIVLLLYIYEDFLGTCGSISNIT
jgi:hypothetical protein